MTTPRTPTSGGGVAGPITLMELIDLALCSPEVGAVNFNILRILLRDIVEKTGIDKKPAKVNDVEAGQVENYRNYVQGSGAVTPGPGVLKIGPGGGRGPPPPQQGGYYGGDGGGGGGGQPPPNMARPPQPPPQQQQQQQPRSQDQGQGQYQQQAPPQQQQPQNQGQGQPQNQGQGQPQNQGQGQQPQPQNRNQPPQNQPGQQQGQAPSQPPPQQNQAQPQQQQQAQQPPAQNQASPPNQPGQPQQQQRLSNPQNQPPPQNQAHLQQQQRVSQGQNPPQTQQNQAQTQQQQNQGQSQTPRSQGQQQQQGNPRTGQSSGSSGGTSAASPPVSRPQQQQQYQQPQQQQYYQQQQYQQPQQHDYYNADYSDLQVKVARLEKHLDALYQLPTNAEIIDKAKTGGTGTGPSMSVNDMWQTIQLNNRIAAAEAAIQKMASLIEDLAKNMGKVKSETKIMKRDTADLQIRKSDLQVQGVELSEKCEKFGEIVNKLTHDLENLKRGWKKDRDNIEKVLGAQLAKVPSFMKRKQERGGSEDRGSAGGEDLGRTPSEQFERGTQTFAKDGRSSGQSDSQRQGRRSQGDESSSTREQSRGPQRPPLAPEDIVKMSATEILQQVGPDEARRIPTEILKQMNHEQKKALHEVRKNATIRSQVRPESRAPPPPPPIGLENMTKEEIQEVPAEKIEKMGYEEAVNLPPEVIESMTDLQREKLQMVIEKGPPPKRVPSRRELQRQKMRQQQVEQTKQEEQQLPRTKSVIGVATMNEEQIQDIPAADIENEMPYEEAASLPPEVFNVMTPEQKNAVKKVVESGPPPSPKQKHQPKPTIEVPAYDTYDDDIYGDDDYYYKQQSTAPQTTEEMATIPPEQMHAYITPEQAAAIPEAELRKRFTQKQIKELERIRQSRVDSTKKSSGFYRSSGQYYDDDREQFDGDQYDDEVAGDRYSADQGTPEQVAKRRSLKDQSKLTPKQKGSKHHKHHHHHRRDHDDDGGPHTHVDVVQGPIPTAGEPLPPITLEEYLASLPPEEAAALAADTVQRELQKQYEHLQGMQRQLANDIQEKMEFIYQRLLKEIATQNMSTSPYMSVGGPEEALGPGICTGHGMPAGIAVCQFPEAKDKKPGVEAVIEGKVCPGPGVCPGTAACSYCRSDGKPQQRQVQEPVQQPQPIRGSDRKSYDKATSESQRPVATTPATAQQHSQSLSQSHSYHEFDETLLQEMKSLVLLDLEKLRDEVRASQTGVVNEEEMLEKLNAMWEALKLVKHNEEALAIKIARQDAFFKKIPAKTIEKLHKIPEENLDALATGNFQKPMYIPDDTRKSAAVKKVEENFRHTMTRPSPPGISGADKEDIQTLFNNLANLIAESTEQKDKIEQMADSTRILESGMVTKQMLMEALAEKADKGLINQKVSYDEFGNTIDELHTQLHNLMVEGYQRNENWKKVTTDLSEELTEKLDKVELAPIRAFFKNHLKMLDEKVKNLSTLVEEPDAAGTRRKLLRNLNCISCDRQVSISGVTNGPTLPLLGPIPAGHQTASRRALDLHRMRMMKKYDPNTKNLNALEQQKKGIRNRAAKAAAGTANAAEIAIEIDAIDMANRYTGGSHTAIATADVIAAQRKPSAPAPPETGRVSIAEEATEAGADEIPPPSVNAGAMEYMMMEMYDE